MSADWGVFHSPDYPVARATPEELRRPGTSPVGNLAILMLNNKSVGNDIVEMIGLFLAGDARFNVWYGEGAGKVKPSGRELAELRVFSAEILHLVYEAWTTFDSESRQGRVSEEVYGGLLNALRSAVTDTCARMGETLANFGTL
jgi:hypothetical protein